MTTVGYGDITPQGLARRWVSILAMLVGAIFFGGIMSMTAHVCMHIFDDPIERRVADVGKFMQLRGVNRSMKLRVQDSQGPAPPYPPNNLAPELFRLLSPSLQRELSLAMLSEVVLNFPLFEGTQSAFLAELAQAHTWSQCAKGDIVGEEGQLITEIFFVVQGTIHAYLGE
eukprot:CAMPEP_0180717756 /NCGR_PEP_ID=MMETSP1038_2-20121128/14140_1 /TAXON_ID=632150 /ORGANISM="Azadinium spinosum, Strain 3D9" /LENGTH=170 /DNA_ID=CAMNT_0022750239 /DNA_START=119 /DNA_END=629 /DNA_ORIENTATION=-